MIDRQRALDLIAASPLADLADELAPLLAPSLRIGVQAVPPNDLPLGASRFGGMPDFPAGWEWPRYKERPLGLAAQLNLAELAQHEPAQQLPAHGWLYFFFDATNDSPWEEQPGDPRSWCVLHFDGGLGDLHRVDPPGQRIRANEFRLCAIGLESELTLPSYGSTLLDGLEIGEARRNDYENLVFTLPALPPLPPNHAGGKLRQLVTRFQHRLIGDPIHRMFGHPEHFQLDPRIDWERLSLHQPVVGPAPPELRSAARNWELLLQVDAYQDGPSWQWGDNGTLYFGIRPADLAAGNFAAVEWTVECG